MPPEHGLVPALGQHLDAPQRPALPPTDRADDQHERVVHARLPGEEAAEQLVVRRPADLVVDGQRRVPTAARRVLAADDLGIVTPPALETAPGRARERAPGTAPSGPRKAANVCYLPLRL